MALLLRTPTLVQTGPSSDLHQDNVCQIHLDVYKNLLETANSFCSIGQIARLNNKNSVSLDSFDSKPLALPRTLENEDFSLAFIPFLLTLF